jgi:signal transduction histidine kinase
MSSYNLITFFEVVMEINILLVEDNMADVRLTKEMIIEANSQLDIFFKLDFVNSLENAKIFLENNKIDIVLLDLGLPQSSGIETVEKFKEFANELPLVAYTGLNDLRIGAQLLKVGADDYICKTDTTTSILVKTITNNLQRYQLFQELKRKDEMLISQSKNAAMGDMISIIAHQWRQPLSIVSMAVNTIKADIELDNARIEDSIDNLNLITKQIAYLSDTIDDFRNFFKPCIKKEETSISSILKSINQLIGKSLENNNISLKMEVNNDRKIAIYVSELIQVFINIINNAKEALLENKIENPYVKIHCNIEDQKILINIEDNAGGIDEKYMDRIFEPYFTTKESLNGTGLGLYISKIIIEKHFNGQILVDNFENGARFHIQFSI